MQANPISRGQRYSGLMSESVAESYETRNEDAAGTMLFLCDHASNRVPEELGTLGLTRSDFALHIAYDIGAAELTRALADRFSAPAILAGRVSWSISTAGPTIRL